MITELIERVARDTDRMDNKAAWQEIQARLKAAGVPKNQTASLRDAIWFERRRYAATKQHPNERKHDEPALEKARDPQPATQLYPQAG